VHRRKYIEEFISHPESLAKDARNLDRVSKLPGFIRGLVGRLITRKMKKSHFGQVAPIEDIKKIFDLTNTIVRVACLCRHVTLGAEKRYCYGISLSPDGGWLAEISRGLNTSFFDGPDTKGFETLSRDEALSAFHEHEHEGLCHTLWTFHTPFIAGICNCDRSDCLAMRATITHAIPVMFRSEFVAEIVSEECSGCRQCMRMCQFGALTYSASNKKAVIDQKWCYGCGICRSACKNNAIRLEERMRVPAVANLW
jgi:NAD-dependent dihydropyrimidine dehydrogenase PreA subunit